MTKRTDKSNTRKKILTAGISEFAERGFSGTRMSAIAARADVNQALIHYHFGNKEQLYRSIFHTFMNEDADRYIDSIKKLLHSWETTPVVELCAVLYLHVSAYSRINTEDFNKLMARELAERSEFIRDIIAEHALPKLTFLEEIIQKGIDLGHFETADPLLFVLNTIVFIDTHSQAENLIKGTEWYESIYEKEEDSFFSFLTEYVFKALRPKEKELYIPSLDDEQTAVLDSIIEEIKNDLPL